jgi:3-hydroxyisobutyrate dehydrogenase-like beta-hydroxyacid dehydrogenase
VADVTVLGTGRMGAAMARKLVEAGHRVILWNRTFGTAQALAVECGATATEFAADAVRRADLVISMLADGAVTTSVLLDDDVLGAFAPGALVCDMSTSGVEAARRLDTVLTTAGARFVDAPVSGSVSTIATGQLLVMGSGVRSSVDAATPVLSAFAKRVVYVGDAGAGQAMKLAVNLVVHALNAAVSEALTLAGSAGVAPDAAYDIFQESVVAAPFVVYKRSAFLDPETPVAMTLALTRKDLDLITDFAADQGVPAGVVEAVRDEVTRACAAGYADQDMAALARFLDSATRG